VHCAAERRPDVVESQPDAASQLNVAASGNLAKEAGNDNFIKFPSNIKSFTEFV
jgi:dTDP-4-dehydrorhamnose reductase